MEEILGFKAGDRVRLEGSDGSEHVIREFELVEGMYSDFYFVHFNDNAAKDFLSEDFTNLIKL